MRPLNAPRVTRAVLAATVAFVASGAVDRPVAAQEAEWIPPVGGTVVRAFVAPIAEYAAGHRGVDFAAAAGTAVHAANDGTVSFAGDVAGALHVVVAHEGGIRTSYSFLASTDVRAGQHVSRGQVIGRAGGTGDGHGAGVLHFGVRIGDRYVDPMLLFRPRDLTQIVRLVPPEELEAAALPDSSRDVAELSRIVAEEGDDHACSGVVGDVAGMFGLGGAAESACDALEEAVDTTWRALVTLGEEAEAFVDALEGVVTDVIDRMWTTGESIEAAAAAVAGAVATTVVAVIKAVAEYARDVYERLTSCPQPAPKQRVRGSGNVAFAMGGLDSERHVKADGTISASYRFRATALGYGRGDVHYASYVAKSAVYGKEVTHQSLDISARALADQLAVFAREHPNQPIDLIGHSQGGVVVFLFLTRFYVGHEHEYPRVENVLLYASPLEGTPTADMESAVDRHPVAGPIARGATDYAFGATALEQLRHRSPLITAMRAAPQPRGVRVLSLAGSEDLAVPSSSSDPPVGEKFVLPVGQTWWPDDHDAILSDGDAVSAAQTFLSGGSPVDSCGPLVDRIGDVETTLARRAALVLAASPGARPPGVEAPR